MSPNGRTIARVCGCHLHPLEAAANNKMQLTSGPLALWREYAGDVQGRGVDGGHFFPEAGPGETAAALASFFEGDAG
jgi:hypothetical protein